MTQKTPETAKGCLNRLAILFGLFWLVAIGVAFITRIDTNGSGFEITGSFLPFLAFFVVAGVIRRRAAQSRSRSAKSPTGRPKSRPTLPVPSPKPPGRAETTPAPTAKAPPPPVVMPRVQKSELPDKAEPPARETPSAEPSAESAALLLLDLGDLQSHKPLSSEERLKQAREKYLKKE